MSALVLNRWDLCGRAGVRGLSTTSERDHARLLPLDDANRGRALGIEGGAEVVEGDAGDERQEQECAHAHLDTSE